MAGDTKKLNFAESINKLEEINSWFQTEDIDLDEGLLKLKEGKDLIKKCRERLAEVENEFVKIKEDFAEETVVVSSEEEEEVVSSQQTLISVKNEVPDPEDIPF